MASTPWNWWAREDLHLQGSQTLDLWGLLFPLNHSPKTGAPTRSCTELIRLPSERIANNALRAIELASLTRLRSEATADEAGFEMKDI